MPDTLKRLTLFEDFNEDFNSVFNSLFQQGSIAYTELVRIANPSLGIALAKISLFLEQLSASFLIDAKDFFQACRPNWIWKDLVSLALTSRLLNSTEARAEINNMLYAAGIVARNMPKLRIMEIWSGGRGQATIFRYHVMNDSTMISWHSVWDLQLESRVIKTWKAVALKYSRRELCVEVDQLPSGSIQSHAMLLIT